MTKLALFLFIGFAGMLVGCSTGSSQFSSSRMDYNQALQETEQKELLLNIVRLRYNEPPAFLQVTGISSQFEFTSELLIGGETDGDGRLEVFSPEAAISFSSSPTVTFSPQQEKEFTRQIMAPVGPETLYRLIEYGWGLERVFALMVRRINNVGTPVGLEREALEVPTEQLDVFRKLGLWQRTHQLELALVSRSVGVLDGYFIHELGLDDLTALREKGYGLIREDDGYTLTEEKESLELIVSAPLAGSADWLSLADRLKLDGQAGTYRIDPMRNSQQNSFQLTVALRSPLEMMAFLSRGVSIPASHHTDRVAPDWPIPDGLEFFHVHASHQKPSDVYLAVEHLGTWFYIPKDDLESRRTLGLMSSLIRQEVQAGGAENLPVLTLPVGR
ncbi:hypothetical protein RPW65_12270 [Pseudomonas sp. NyZ704]|nr:hypothetical protein RPW65_12270 [Pseudomonas sp. NyZ704]